MQIDFFKSISDSNIKTIMITGCGGGIDFLHSMLIYPELQKLKKRIVFCSNSFVDLNDIEDNYDAFYSNKHIEVKKVSSNTIVIPNYCPEYHLCKFLDDKYPLNKPHFIYASYARDFTVKQMYDYYVKIVEEENIDAIIAIDGGSDSLMKGDEEGLGDPIEDAVSLAAISMLNVSEKFLLSIGLGCDRFNHVSDASSLRAISDAIRNNSFLGSLMFYNGMQSFHFYKECIDYINSKQDIKSVISGCIISSGEGYYGEDEIPQRLSNRVNKGELYIWPMMSMMWAFDLDFFAQRSLICKWIKDKNTVIECYIALEKGRESIQIREIEDFPRNEDIRFPHKIGTLNP